MFRGYLDHQLETNGCLNEEHPSYLKRRGIVYFQTFFFQQFPNADFCFSKKMLGLLYRNNSQVSWRKDNREPSIKVEEHALYLPLVKQASQIDCQERHSMMSQLPRQESFSNPFEQASDYHRGGTVTTAISDQVPLDVPSDKITGINYLKQQFTKWRDMYKTAIDSKDSFLATHGSQFYNTFIQSSKDFAREIFLDPTQCENPRFALPQLMRENYYQKGLFYRTEKILVHSYSNCFQHFSVDYTRQLLFDINQGMQTRIAQNQHARSVLKSLLEDPMVSQQNSDMFFQNNQDPKLDSIESQEPRDGEINDSSMIFQKFTSQPLFSQIAKESHEIEESPQVPQLFKDTAGDNPTSGPFAQAIQPAFDLEDDDALLDNLELPTLVLPLKKASMFNMQDPNIVINEDEDLPDAMPTLQPLSLSKPFALDITKLQFAPPALPSLGDLKPIGGSGSCMNFEMVGFNSNQGIFTQSEELTPLYKDVASYQLRQYLLICEAHSNQLSFLLDQINMAPSLNKSYFLFLEDYVEKERNLRYLLRKISQNFIMQEAFQETMLRANVYQSKETQKQPYLCDFLMLEYLDSIWINQVYRSHRENLTNLVIQEVQAVHTLERFEELPEKKEIFRKVINTIHQTEFSLQSNQDFLSISQECCTKEAPKMARELSSRVSRPSMFSNASQFGGSIRDEIVPLMKNYEGMVGQLKFSVKKLISQMQKKSNSVQEYIELCSRYEEFEFHKLEEVEHDYILYKKHYLGKTFAKELAIKLDSNKIAKPPQCGTSDLCTLSSGTSSCSTAAESLSSGGSQRLSPTSKSSSVYQNMSLNQILHPELQDTFFHQLVRGLLKNEEFKKMMETESFMQSLFMLFHIEQSSRSDFTSDINKYLIQCHSQLQDLYAAQPELLASLAQNEEQKNFGSAVQVDSASLSNQMSGESSVQDSYFAHNAFGGQPFSTLGIGSEEDDDQLMMNCCEAPIPALARGYSAQKRQVFKGLSSVIFKELTALEKEFDFKKHIEAQREQERKKALDLIQQRIDSFNMHLQNFNQQQLHQQALGQRPQAQVNNQVSIEGTDIDQEMADETLANDHDDSFSLSQDLQVPPKLIRHNQHGAFDHQNEEIKQDRSQTTPSSFEALPNPFCMQRSSSNQLHQYSLVSGWQKSQTTNNVGQNTTDGLDDAHYDDSIFNPIPVTLQAYQSLQPEKSTAATGYIFKPDQQSSMS